MKVLGRHANKNLTESPDRDGVGETLWYVLENDEEWFEESETNHLRLTTPTKVEFTIVIYLIHHLCDGVSL